MSFETLLDTARIDAMTSAGYWSDALITDHLDRAATATPDQVAFRDSRRTVTYAALRAEVDQCALGLLDLGVTRGDVVSFQLPNWIEFVVVHLATMRIGAISNPLIPIYREREVGFMVGLAESKVVVVPRDFRGFDYPAMIERLRPQLPSVAHVIVVDAADDLAAGHTAYAQFMATPRAPRHLAALRPDADDVALLIFTSGTTGEPKGVMHTHNTTLAALAPIPGRMGIDENIVIHMASTFAHLTGFLYGVCLPIRYGQTCIVQDIWTADEFVALVAEFGINYTSGATPFLVDLLGHLPADIGALASLTRFCCMGAPIPRVMVRKAAQALPTMAVLGGWGQTENALVTIGVPGDPEHKITTDGRAWPGMEVRTVGLDGAPVPPGEEGAVQVRGPFLFVGYAKRLEATRRQFTEDGWFDTGDLATLDADGYLSISGRTKDIIMRGGENIPVAYVENVLYENPEYARVAVVAISDPRLQERACACIVPAPGAEPPTLESVQNYLRDKGVAKHYWPEKVVVMAEFPSTASCLGLGWRHVARLRARGGRDPHAGRPRSGSGSRSGRPADRPARHPLGGRGRGAHPRRGAHVGGHDARALFGDEGDHGDHGDPARRARDPRPRSGGLGIRTLARGGRRRREPRAGRIPAPPATADDPDDTPVAHAHSRIRIRLHQRDVCRTRPLRTPAADRRGHPGSVDHPAAVRSGDAVGIRQQPRLGRPGHRGRDRPASRRCRRRGGVRAARDVRHRLHPRR